MDKLRLLRLNLKALSQRRNSWRLCMLFIVLNFFSFFFCHFFSSNLQFNRGLRISLNHMSQKKTKNLHQTSRTISSTHLSYATNESRATGLWFVCEEVSPLIQCIYCVRLMWTSQTVAVQLLSILSSFFFTRMYKRSITDLELQLGKYVAHVTGWSVVRATALIQTEILLDGLPWTFG